MAKASCHHRTRSHVDERVRVVLERSARGNASPDDWRSIAEIDAERAHRELFRYLQADDHISKNHQNPYQRNRHSIGTVLGFVAGAIGMVMMWVWGVLYLQEAWAGITYGPGLATALTYVSTALVPFGAWAGSRWDNAQHSPEIVPPATDATFDELLERFTRISNRCRARVY